MTSLIKPDDSWRHNIPKKHLCGIFRALFCPSLDKGKMESVYFVHQQTTVDGFPGYKGVREAKVWDG